MGSASLAHVAYANCKSFIAFRSLSDMAGGGESANQMLTTMELASANSAELVRAFMRGFATAGPRAGGTGVATESGRP